METAKKGLIGKSIRFGRKGAKKTILKWVGIMLLGFVVMIGVSSFSNSFLEANPDAVSLEQQLQLQAEELSPSEIFSQSLAMQETRIVPGKESVYYTSQILVNIISTLFMICLTLGAISLTYKGTLTFKDYYTGGSLMLVVKYIVAYILYTVAVGIGFVLLIIPGVWLGMRWKFFDLGVIKEGLGPIDALKHSYRITKGNWWRVFGLQIMQGLIQIPGALLLLIGLFWTIPTAYIADVKAYKILNGEDGEEQPEEDSDTTQETATISTEEEEETITKIDDWKH